MNTRVSFERLFASLSRYSIFVLVFLIPIVYLPWTTDPLEINKQTVLLVFGLFALLGSLAGSVLEKKVRVWKLNLIVLAKLFGLGVLISSLFSLAPVTSFIGQGMQEYTSFLTIAAYLVVFLVGARMLRDEESLVPFFGSLFGGAGIVGLVSIFGVFSGGEVFNLIGTPHALGLYLGCMAVIAGGVFVLSRDDSVGVLVAEGWKGVLQKGLMWISILGFVLVALALDYWVVWMSVLVGLGCMFVFGFIRPRVFDEVRRLVAVMVLFVVSLLFLFIDSPLSGVLPAEVSPSYGASWHVAEESLRDFGWLFGSGPGTYVIDYAKHHVAEVNSTALWDVRFDRSVSHLFTLVSTMGIVGVGLFLLFVGFLLGETLMHVFRERDDREWMLAVIGLSGWAVLMFAMVVYSSNLTLGFVFWFLSAFLMSRLPAKERVIAFRRSPRMALGVSLGFMIVSVGVVTLLFMTSSRYAAEISFARAISADSAGAEKEEVIAYLQDAVRFNRWNDAYYRNLSHAYLLAATEVSEGVMAPNVLRDVVGLAISSGQKSVELSPNNVVNWSTLGDVYRDVASVVADADLFAIAAYEEAVALSPQNPKYYVALGRAHLIRADQLAVYATSEDEDFARGAIEERGAALDRAVEVLGSALALKGDYAPAFYYLALAYSRQGNLSEAVSRLETLRLANPQDVGVGFQLGLLYLQQGKVDEAEAEFVRVIEISPYYSNARWYLSSIYEDRGDIDRAIAEVEVVQTLNPDDTAVLQRLDRLRAGDDVVDDIEPIEPVE